VPELEKIYNRLSECINEINEEGNTCGKRHNRKPLPIVFAEEPFPALKNALVQYLANFRGRLNILRKEPRNLSIPPEQVHSFPGLDAFHTDITACGRQGILTTFTNDSLSHYTMLVENFGSHDNLSVSEMQKLQSIIMYEIGYLRGRRGLGQPRALPRESRGRSRQARLGRGLARARALCRGRRGRGARRR